jgi:adenylate cyclase
LSARLRLLVLLLAALVGLAIAESPAGGGLDRRFQDLARLLKARLAPGPERGHGKVVVVALDEESHLRPPFAELPRPLWTPQLASVVEAALDAGALVVGLDLILATSAEPVLRGYDRPLLQALRRGGDEGRLVLASVQDPHRPLYPAPIYVFALRRDADHIRPANLAPDPDGVARRAMLRLSDGSLGFGAEIARRAGAEVPAAAGLLLDPDADRVPAETLSFADVHACIEAGRSETLRRFFAGRVVLIGSMLSDVDRFRAGNWLAATGPEAIPDQRCSDVPEIGGLPTPAAGTMAGVQLQGLIVDQLLTGRLPRELPLPGRWAAALLVGLLAAMALATRGATPGAVALTAAVILAPLPVAAAMLPDLVLPAGRLTASAAAAAVTALVLREALVGRALRRMRRGFALYLPRPVVERLLEQGTPELGGELREVTMLFADLAGYTGIAENAQPPELVAMLNAHFARMGAAVEAHGGFVLQYLGDGMLAVFGAPAALRHHPTEAVDAAVTCLQATLAAGSTLRLRIGVATGKALVGNIGSPYRFNYAVVGDVVNLSARLEGLNKAYGTSIVVAETTAHRYGGRHTLREIDRVLVAGRAAPLALFEPRPESDPVGSSLYAIALASYRAGSFAEAARLFETLTPADPVAATMAERASTLAADPPAAWDGVTRHTRK